MKKTDHASLYLINKTCDKKYCFTWYGLKNLRHNLKGLGYSLKDFYRPLADSDKNFPIYKF